MASSWTNSPQYLKGIQKIRGIDPSKRAVTQTLVNELEGLYAGEEMQKQIRAQQIALRGDRQKHNIKMGEKDIALSEKNIDFMKDSSNTAELLGYGNIALSGYMGYSDMKQKKEEADWYRSLMERAYPSKKT
ncbi:unnamed protein product [marine sediment metagenome]|uniref:Uncharacterized protein n=1 Tax=marine sediment metagenome TaxID=412755 RepID=X1DUV1_9ZZZZ